MSAERWPGGIERVPPGRYDFGQLTVGVWGGYLVQIVRMVVNHRVLMTASDPHDLGSWDFGWCYESAPAALAAVAVWNPQTEAEPPGYARRPPTATVRVAGQRYYPLAERIARSRPVRERAAFLLAD